MPRIEIMEKKIRLTLLKVKIPMEYLEYIMHNGAWNGVANERLS